MTTLPPDVHWYDPADYDAGADAYPEQTGRGAPLVPSNVSVVDSAWLHDNGELSLDAPLGSALMLAVRTTDDTWFMGRAYDGNRRFGYAKAGSENGNRNGAGGDHRTWVDGVDVGTRRSDIYDAASTGVWAWCDARDMDLSTWLGVNLCNILSGEVAAIYHWTGTTFMTDADRAAVEAHAGELLEPRGHRPAYLPAPGGSGATPPRFSVSGSSYTDTLTLASSSGTAYQLADARPV